MRRGEAESLLAVIFEDVPRPEIVSVELAPSRESETTVRQLEDELRVTQQDLQSTIEELQASNEELRMANEEVVSSNEELQSTNEELETSKEELQSVNEELTTVNSQLQEKIERLDKAHADMTNFLEATQIATLFMDSELRIKLFTPATTRLLKVIASDTGRPISDLSMNFLDYDLTADARAVARDGSVIEREVSHADGSFYLLRLTPYRTHKGQVDGVVATFADVTRLRRAERQTRRLAIVVTASNDAVILAGSKGDIQAWNRGAERMYGWSETEALRMNIRDLTPPGAIAEDADIVRRVLAGETIASFDTQRLTRDGRVLEVWLTATAVRDEAGLVEAIATTERDITERKQAEKQLRHTVTELARSNKDLEQFAHVCSHDLQEPVRMVALYMQLLESRYKSKLDADADEFIGFAVDGAKRMQRLVTDLLAYAGVGAHESSLAPTALEKVLQAAMANLKTTIEESAATITHDPLPTVMAETTQFTQLLQNLISNAIKFRRQEPPRIHISARRVDDQWQFSVRDNGIGIEPQYFERIFVVFQRLHARESYEGTGIGLAICKRIVERHGGRIWVESEPDRGSTFFFTLPAE
jgi:two-component system, chemotaxis family, CheB/CheR fusion protein